MSSLKSYFLVNRFTVHTSIACLLVSFASLLLIINIVNCTDYQCLYGKKQYLNQSYLCFINNSISINNNQTIYETYYTKARWNCYALLDLTLFIHFTFYYLGIYLCTTTYQYHIRNTSYNNINTNNTSYNQDSYPRIQECNETFIIVLLYFHIIGIIIICFYLLVYGLFVGIPRVLISLYQLTNHSKTIEYEDL
jgi:hypothetical protein